MQTWPETVRRAAHAALVFALTACLLGLPILVAADEDHPAPGEAARLTVAASEKFRTGDAAGARELLGKALTVSPGYLGAEQLAAVVCQVLGDQPASLHHYRFVQRTSLPDLPESASAEARSERDLLVTSEALIIYLANRERLDRKLTAYLPDPRLARVARQHSEEMRDLKYFSHESPTPGFTTIRDRFTRVFPGVQGFTIAENIACRYAVGIFSLNAENMLQTHVEWMNSEGHRANLLSTELERIGVGVAMNHNGDYWATQFFARF
jgi:uncharacterized protein YkwD